MRAPQLLAEEESLKGDYVARILLFIALLVLFGPYLFLRGEEISLSDDAYYYLLPAVNFWKLGYFSFDGLTHTNGFHPLWMLWVVLCALPLHFLGWQELLPQVILWSSILLILWGGQVWFGVLRRAEVARTQATLMVLVTVLALRPLLLFGMETAAVFWSLALLASYLTRQIPSDEPLHSMRLACYSLLVLFSRLDGGFFLVLLYGLLVFYGGFRRVVLAGLLLTLMASPYLVLNKLNHGAMTPISGQVKQHWGDRYELETSGKTFGPTWAQVVEGPGKRRLVEVVKRYIPREFAAVVNVLTFHRFPSLESSLLWLYGILCAMSIMAGLVLYRGARRGLSPSALFLIRFGGLLGSFYLLSMVYYALSYDRVWNWYGAVGILVFGGVIAFLLGALSRGRLGRCVVVLYMIALVLYWTGNNVNAVQSLKAGNPKSLRGVKLALADWLRNETNEAAVSSGWAVGEIGWFAKRSVINLEGLVGDRELFEANRSTDLLPFLAKYNVEYVCNFWRPSYAPLPEAVLTPTASDGAWKDGLVRYFWTLRLRSFMDCPDAFSIVHRYDAGDHRATSGYVLAIAQEVVASFLAAREAWRAELNAWGSIIEAEDYTSLGAGQVEANIRRTEGYFIRGADIRYALDNLAPGAYVVYGRVCNLASVTGHLLVDVGSGNSDVAIPATPQWRHVRLATIQVSRASQERHPLHIVSMGKDVYLDQLYFVAAENQAKFEAVAADWWRGRAK